MLMMRRYIRGMRLQRHSTVAQFMSEASPFLLRDEAEHGLMLGVAAECDAAECDAAECDAGLSGAWWAIVRDDDDRIVAAALRTTDKLILSRCERRGAAALIADAVLASVPELPGVLGPPDAVDEFVARAGGEWRDGIAHRIYECRYVAAPTNVPGAMRFARGEDRDIIVRWIRDFTSEALGKPVDERAAAARAESVSTAGELCVWEVDGAIVSMAAAVAPTPHGIRVSAVYTPPDQRGHGYASALTAAVTTRQLETGRALVFLYTDLANPISNRIYQRIGYVPVADVAMRLRPGVSPV